MSVEQRYWNELRQDTPPSFSGRLAEKSLPQGKPYAVQSIVHTVAFMKKEHDKESIAYPEIHIGNPFDYVVFFCCGQITEPITDL